MSKDRFIQVAGTVPFDTVGNHFSSTNVQETIEEARKTDSFYTQATSASTLVMTSAFQKVILFTGTVSGQVLRLPPANTVLVGTWYTIINTTNDDSIAVQDGSSTLIYTLGAGEAIQVYCSDISSVAGVWTKITPLALFGSQYQTAGTATETSTTSATFQNKVTLTTISLPAGDYRLSWSLQWRAANANRGIGIRVQRDAVELANYTRFSGSASDAPPESGFITLTAQTAGVKVYTLDFRVAIGSTTIFVKNSYLELWRTR
jgi:hypothetical protein